jgi:hypothetical protein
VIAEQHDKDQAREQGEEEQAKNRSSFHIASLSVGWVHPNPSGIARLMPG